MEKRSGDKVANDVATPKKARTALRKWAMTVPKKEEVFPYVPLKKIVSFSMLLKS